MSIIGVGPGIASSGWTVHGPPNLLYGGSQVSFLETQRPGCDVDHPPPSSAEFLTEQNCTPTCTPPSVLSWRVIG